MNMKKITLLCTCIFVFLFAGVAISAKAQRINHLGSPRTAFHLPALKSVADLQKMALARKGDMQAVLELKGWKGNMDDLMSAIAAGKVDDTTIARGAEIPFMAVRRGGKPGTIDNLIWVGSRPFEAYHVEFDSNGYIYHFYFPKKCSNFWMEEKPSTKKTEPVMNPTVGVQAADVCVTQPVKVKITTANAEPNTMVQVTIDGKTEEMAASAMIDKDLAAYSEPGSHTITVAMQGASPTTATFNVKACPPACVLTMGPPEIKRGTPLTFDASGSSVASGVTVGLKSAKIDVSKDGVPVESFDLTAPNLKKEAVKYKKHGIYTVKATVTDEAGQTSANACEATFEIPKPKFPLFVGAFFGKERLVQESEDVPGFFSGHCDPQLGFKIGVLPQIGENMEVELSFGGKINTDLTENSSVFADVALNGLMGRGFLGGGVSFWDLTEDDTRAVALLIQGGFDLSEDGVWQFVGEARAPFDQFDDLGNNYQFWGGIRIRPWR